MPASSVEYHRLRRAALGTALVFTASGSLIGVWAARLPAVADRLHATPGELGPTLLAMGIGSLVSMPLTGHLCRKFGSRQVVLGMMVLCCVAFAALGYTNSLIQLAAVLFTFGIFMGSWDVAMNIQGSAAELRAGREWMPRYHACWSAGNIIGAGTGALAARLDMAVGGNFVLSAAIAVAAGIVGVAAFVDERTVASDGEEVRPHGRSRGRVITRHLLLIGLVTLSATIIEGGAVDWLPIYLNREGGVSKPASAIAYAIFALAMAGGRFFGAGISERVGRHTAVRVGGVLAVVGVSAVVFSPVLAGNYVGALFWGLGVCLVYPAGMTAAGETSRPAESIAFVSTLGYGAILTGPPLIGTLADHVGLGRALLVLLVLGAAVAAFAPAVRRTAPVAAAEPALSGDGAA